MADIRQAAKWMQEGKRVTRPGYGGHFSKSLCDFVKYRATDSLDFFPYTDMLDIESLLADDWEIAE